MSTTEQASETPSDTPPFRYTAALAQDIEIRWQEWWDSHHTFETPNPSGPMGDPQLAAERGEKLFVLDMKGYLNNPEATRNTIDDEGWLHTGDVAIVDEHQHVSIVDRVKELIKYKGFQVPPAELEALIVSHPKVLDVAVIGIPDVEAGELPKAFVVAAPGSGITAEELQEYVAEHVSSYKRIRQVEFVDEIPKSPSGKILRRLLRDRS